MKKKVLGFCLFAMLFALCLSAEAQQAKKVPRIGFVTQGSALSCPLSGSRLCGEGLRELGWIEGKNIIIEHRRTRR